MTQTWKHGASAYKRGLCRCDICTKANTRRCLEAQARRTARKNHTQLDHGTPSTYSNWGCRCDPCTTAHGQRCADYNRRRKQAVTVGNPTQTHTSEPK